MGIIDDKYGPAPYTYYTGSGLNRYSFLRNDEAFLSAAYNHPAASFLVLRNLVPPVTSSPETTPGNKPPRPVLHKLSFVEKSAIQAILPKHLPTENDQGLEKVDAATQPLILFLGLDESVIGADALVYKQARGKPYFAVEYTTLASATNTNNSNSDSVPPFLAGASFNTPPIMLKLSVSESGLYAQARMYLDWVLRNPFCAGCGARTRAIHGGTKLWCTRSNCATRTTLSNLAFPRTDVSVIAAVLNERGDKLLLGRNKNWPPGFYSCLAGFLEPGESVEDGVRREVWEEAGLDIGEGRVVVYSTQPWPYPANIMVGCIAQLPSGEHGEQKIDLGNDPELSEAKWFSFAEVGAALDHAAGRSTEASKLLVPPPEAVAHALLKAIVNWSFVKSKL